MLLSIHTAQGSAYNEELSGPVPSRMAPGRMEKSLSTAVTAQDMP